MKKGYFTMCLTFFTFLYSYFKYKSVLYIASTNLFENFLPCYCYVNILLFSVFSPLSFSVFISFSVSSSYLSSFFSLLFILQLPFILFIILFFTFSYFLTFCFPVPLSFAVLVFEPNTFAMSYVPITFFIFETEFTKLPMLGLNLDSVA